MPPKKQKRSRKNPEGDQIEEFTLEDSHIPIHSTSSVAAFQTKRHKLYEDARSSVNGLIMTSTQLLEQARVHTLETKLHEAETRGLLRDYTQRHSNQNDAYKEWYGKSGAFVARLGQQRSTVIDDTSRILNTATTERATAWREFSKTARLQVEKSREEEKLATDAATLIKHYKNLLTGADETKGQRRRRQG